MPGMEGRTIATKSRDELKVMLPRSTRSASPLSDDSRAFPPRKILRRSLRGTELQVDIAPFSRLD